MASESNISKFFDQEAFSDITIQFGSRQVRCHKIILCTKSKYFNNICGPGKRFVETGQAVVETGQAVVELKEDDEEAVESMLRWLYTFDYESDATKKLPSQFDFHAAVCAAADKYGLPPLRDETLRRLVTCVNGADDDTLVAIIGTVKASTAGSVTSMAEEGTVTRGADEVKNLNPGIGAESQAQKIIKGGNDAGRQDSVDEPITTHRKVVPAETSTAVAAHIEHFSEDICKIVQQVRDERLPTLLKHTGFRALLKKDPKECMQLIDRYIGDSFEASLTEMTWVACDCKRQSLRAVRQTSFAEISCTNARCKRVVPLHNLWQCWVKR